MKLIIFLFYRPYSFPFLSSFRSHTVDMFCQILNIDTALSFLGCTYTVCWNMEAVSPLSTLARGYSVTTAADGNVLKQAKQVKTGDTLTTRLADGWIESEVKSVIPAKKARASKPRSAG